MGSIIYINKDPKTWPAFNEGYTLTGPYNYEPLIKVRYGTCDDDPDGVVDLEMDMRRTIYDNLVKGKYRVSKNSIRELKILDENNNIIEPIKEGVLY